jgi:hypothetical protein
VCAVGCGAPLLSWMGCCSLNNDHCGCGLGALFPEIRVASLWFTLQLESMFASEICSPLCHLIQDLMSIVMREKTLDPCLLPWFPIPPPPADTRVRWVGSVETAAPPFCSVFRWLGSAATNVKCCHQRHRSSVAMPLARQQASCLVPWSMFSQS